MYPGYWGPHFVGWMWVMPVVFLIVCIALIFVLMSWRRDSSRGESALHVLERRYAKGEITTEQYLEIKHKLMEK